jgi:hypothetical protein
MTLPGGRLQQLAEDAGQSGRVRHIVAQDDDQHETRPIAPKWRGRVRDLRSTSTMPGGATGRCMRGVDT